MKIFLEIALIVIVVALVLIMPSGGFVKGPVGNASVPEPAQSVDLTKYVGRWYEIARYEARFQKNCEAVTADYTANQDGTIKVINTCHQDSVDGKIRTAEAVAKIVAGSNNAKLKVSFFRPFYGDYWVLDHAKDYSWSIVGEPSGRYLWLLFRTPHPTPKALSLVELRAKDMGYDLNLLRHTKHP